MLKYKFKVLGMMNKITSITRKKIFNLLSNGYVESAILGEDVRITFNFYGTLSCVEFLTRLYSLKDMPSKDSRLNDETNFGQFKCYCGWHGNAKKLIW